jgi:hypothetical protein
MDGVGIQVHILNWSLKSWVLLPYPMTQTYSEMIKRGTWLWAELGVWELWLHKLWSLNHRRSTRAVLNCLFCDLIFW